MYFISPAQMTKAVGMLRDSLAALDRDWPGVRRMLLDSRAGWPAGGERSRSTDVPDPTGLAALEPDEAHAALQRVGEIIPWMVAVSLELDAMRQRWKPYSEAPKPCGNMHCPDRAPAAPGRKRCFRCDRHKRAQGVERGTMAPEERAS